MRKYGRDLRAEQLRLVTLAEHDGIPADESVADVDWLELAGTRNWTVLMKDQAIRRNELEAAGVVSTHREGRCKFHHFDPTPLQSHCAALANKKRLRGLGVEFTQPPTVMGP